MALTKQQTRDLYRKRAQRYDLAILIFYLFGIRVQRYRKSIVQALNLQPGDTVIDLGCGTGLNFPLLHLAVGETGRIIGVDLTDAMLEEAHSRVARFGWRNVDLVQSDVAQYAFPDEVAGILSTLAITLVPEYDQVIQTAAQALKVGGRLAVLDLKKPSRWPEWLIRLAAWLNSPYGVSLEIANRHPWESIRQYLDEVTYREYYYGALYLSVGQRS